MLLIFRMLLAEGLLPLAEINDGKESIGVIGLIVNDCKIQPVGKGQRLAIYLGTADDEDFIFVLA